MNAATEQKQFQEGSKGGSQANTGKLFVPRDALMARANSLKKAIHNMLDMTEKEIDAQVEVTAEVHTHMQPVHEESAVQTSPNLSSYSSQSSIDSERHGSFDVGPQSLDSIGPRSSMDSGQRSIDSGPSSLDMRRRELGPRSSVESTRRVLELGLHDSGPQSSTESGPSTQGRFSVTSHGSVVDPAP